MDTLHVAKREMDKFATAIEYFHYPTLYTDLEGDILAYNQRLLETLGFQAGTDVEHIKFIDLIAVEERHFVFRHYEKILLGAGSAVSEVYPLLSRDGTKVDVEITGSLLEDDKGTQYGILFTLQKPSPVRRERWAESCICCPVLMKGVLFILPFLLSVLDKTHLHKILIKNRRNADGKLLSF